MTRLFLSLFAVIVVVLLGYLFGANQFARFIFKDPLEEMRKQQLSGVITHLDEAIHGLNADQRRKRLTEIRQLFRYDVALTNIDDLAISAHDKQRLNKGEFLSQNKESAEFIYYRSALAGHAWYLQLDPTRNDMNRDFLIGPMALLDQKLTPHPQEQWPQIVKDIDKQFGIPVRLIEQQAITQNSRITQSQQADIMAGRIVILNQQQGGIEYIYKRIRDSEYIIQIDNMQPPFLLRHANSIILSLLALLIGLAIWLWLRPVWQDLRQLQLASQGFGRGELTTRIPVSRYSFIKAILQAFNNMAERIEQLITSHKTLTNAVSHELRTPVSRLRFSLVMLEKAKQDSDRQRHLAEMNTDIEELDEMLGALLSYARMDRQDVAPEKTPLFLETWLQEQLERMQSCNEKAIKITAVCHDLPDTQVAVMDAKLMTRALHNLLQNACRYAAREIRVSLSYTASGYELTVDDDGCGIPEHYHASLFDPFTRVDESRERESGGYGLGLAIVKQVAHMHRGEVSIAKSTLGGARFMIRWQ